MNFFFDWICKLCFIIFASLNLLNDDLKNDSTLRELESDILACWSDLTELGNSVESLLGCNDNAPLTAVLLLQQLDQHVCGIIGKTFGSNGSNDVVFAEVFEVLICVLRSLNPEWIVLCRFTLVGNVSIEQPKTLLHRNQILDQLN